MKPILFLFPIIALALIVMFYMLLLKNIFNKRAFNKYVLTIAGLAFITNLLWELVQIPLYIGGIYSISHILFCTLASVADAIMTLLLYMFFALLFKQPFWINKISWPKALIVIFTGSVGATLSEIRHLLIGSWAYSSLMPIIAIVNVGVSPVLQFMILPLFIYWLSFYLLHKPTTNATIN